ncbi:unnamed protein product [Sphagnum jensenii]|uniref:BTB/POZ domain-containing protein n=1 Tax=Sphagnum jensenii TaxID=128206 RepID=A0ABP1BHC4_9BRYO
MTFHFHKFPLVSRSGRLAKLVEEMSEEDDNEESFGCQIQLVDIPRGAEAFELAAKFSYQVKVELTTTNVMALQCVVEYLEMTNEFGDGNLIAKIKAFLQQVVLQSWLDSVQALESYSSSMPQVEELGIVENAYARAIRTNWWYNDLSTLSLPLLERVVVGLEARGTRPESTVGALVHYAKKSLPGLHMRHSGCDAYTHGPLVPITITLAKDDQRIMLETIEA